MRSLYMITPRGRGSSCRDPFDSLARWRVGSLPAFLDKSPWGGRNDGRRGIAEQLTSARPDALILPDVLSRNAGSERHATALTVERTRQDDPRPRGVII